MTNSEKDERDAVKKDLEDRRVIDNDWKTSVDEKLTEGGEKFKQLAEGQTTMLTKLKENTDATLSISERLNKHIETTGNWKTELAPVLSAYTSMQSGVQTIGKIGSFFGSVGKWTRRAVVWLTPFAAFIGAIVYFFKTGIWKWPL